jgi:GT2 family glycosyltransferase
VLNLNGRHHLPPLLAHLALQSVRNFELVFVDNGSVDDSVALVEQGCTAYGIPLRLIRNRHNNGFAPACNQGVALARAPWVAMLNNDTRPAPDWLAHLLDAAHSGERVSMVASKMLRAHRPDQIDSAGIAVDWAGIAWDRRGGEPDRPDETDLVEIFGPCGGAALYHRDLLDALGGFDGDFLLIWKMSIWRGGRASLVGAVSFSRGRACCTPIRPRWATPRRSSVSSWAATRSGCWPRTCRMPTCVAAGLL